jgi:hypothetical protein
MPNTKKPPFPAASHRLATPIALTAAMMTTGSEKPLAIGRKADR